jgi:hypothetical protein
MTNLTLNVRHVISGIERAVLILSTAAAEKIQWETCYILKKTKTQKSNSFKVEQNALRALKENEVLIILPADKGNATVIMNTEDYHGRMNELFSEPTYKVFQKHPIRKVEKTSTVLIEKPNITRNIAKKLIPSALLPPRFYGLPKIHKENAEVCSKLHWLTYLPTPWCNTLQINEFTFRMYVTLC